MKDEFVREILGELESEIGQPDASVGFKVNVLSSFANSRKLGSYSFKNREFNKRYNLGDLTVYIEARLGTKEYPSNSNFLVTPQQQRDYLKKNKQFKKEYIDGVIMGGSLGVKTDVGLMSSQGPIVQSPIDYQLNTIIAERVLVEYSGLNLHDFDSALWKEFVADICDKYKVSIKAPSKDIAYYVLNNEEEANNFGQAVNSEAFKLAHQQESVFRDVILKKGDLRQGIFNVYNAGQTLKKALEAESGHLAQKYL